MSALADLADLYHGKRVRLEVAPGEGAEKARRDNSHFAAEQLRIQRNDDRAKPDDDEDAGEDGEGLFGGSCGRGSRVSEFFTEGAGRGEADRLSRGGWQVVGRTAVAQQCQCGHAYLTESRNAR